MNALEHYDRAEELLDSIERRLEGRGIKANDIEWVNATSQLAAVHLNASGVSARFADREPVPAPDFEGV